MVSVVGAGQHLVGADRLVVVGQNPGDMARHLRCDDGVHGLQVGVAWGLDELAMPPVVRSPQADGRQKDEAAEVGKDSAGF